MFSQIGVRKLKLWLSTAFIYDRNPSFANQTKNNIGGRNEEKKKVLHIEWNEWGFVFFQLDSPNLSLPVTMPPGVFVQ